MAGGAHVDRYSAELGAHALARDLEIPGFDSGCDLETNPVKIGAVQSALLNVLNKWIEGEVPPPSKLIELYQFTWGRNFSFNPFIEHV